MKWFGENTMQNQLVGASAAAQAITQNVECAARSDAKVLITGESGVGKEIVARLIHQQSRRARMPLVTINCAGIPDSLLESELFGHVRGSFTDAYRDKRGWLEQAHGGTVFLDEVGEMTLRMQALLLRFLENGEIQRVGSDRPQAKVDVRVIAATNRSLQTQIAEKTFRLDLYYRLNVVHVPIPPLRERRDDIPLLVAHFIPEFSERHQLEAPRVPDDVIAKLTAYDWPGNVRELKNVIERLVIRNQSGTIALADLPCEIFGKGFEPAPAPCSPKPATRPPTPTTSLGKLTPEAIFELMSVSGESFWSAVHGPFMSRDLTRQDVRAVVSRGLELTRGSYKALLPAFNLEPGDYKRLLSFLRKHQCRMPFQEFRQMPTRHAAGGHSREDSSSRFERNLSRAELEFTNARA
jgi:transcriptional regulator with PAS, ATPase and Fis domain